MTDLTHTAQKAMTIRGRTYSVEARWDHEHDQGFIYTLHGKRSAEYHTMRFVTTPDRMFLVALTRGGHMMNVNPLGGAQVELTDADGTLEVVRS